MEKSRPSYIVFVRTFVTVAAPCFLILLYQRLTWGWPRRCRFFPTCSDYMRQSILEMGLWRGGWAGLQRLGKCHPWHAGGYDPIDAESKGTAGL